MANQGYLTMTGERQGLISAGCSAQDSIGNKCQTADLDEIQVLSFVHDMAQVGHSPHASDGPIVITKNIDKSTPLLAQALDQREELKCVLDFYRVSAYGNQEKFYTAELRGAVIVSLSTCTVGVITAAHGANNIYENSRNLLERNPDTRGPLRNVYQYIAGSEGGGNITYGTADVGLSVYGVLTPTIKPDAWRIFKYIKADYEMAYKQVQAL
jgi:type VI secretion system Hcp family effector